MKINKYLNNPNTKIEALILTEKFLKKENG